MDALQPALPSAAYISADAFARERRDLFGAQWFALCRAEEVPDPGDWQVFEVLGDSILLLRGPDNVLRAFHNVCRHRGARICRPRHAPPRAGRTELPDGVTATGLIRCPYHAWTYAPDGRLLGAPFLTDAPGFDRNQFGLYALGCAIWGGFVFLHLNPETAAPLADQLGPIPARIANYGLADLRIGHRIAYSVAANWKILCENYNECYHCGPLHPELCALVPAFRAAGGDGLTWDDGVPHRPGAVTFTWSGTTSRAPLPALNAAERTRHKGELAYPNLFLSLACDHVAAFILHPRAADRTDIDCLFLFAADEIAKPGFDHADASSFWDTVNQQDWEICERVQQGMGCSHHVQGYYAPMEDANLDMRRYLARFLG